MAVDAALRAIGEPRRREILRLVWDAERSSGEIASHFDITGPAVSQHLKVLREAGLVTERRDGTRHLFSANREALQELLPDGWAMVLLELLPLLRLCGEEEVHDVAGQHAERLPLSASAPPPRPPRPA